MSKKAKKIFRRTLIGVLASMFVLFLSVPNVGLAYVAPNLEEIQEGRASVQPDENGKELFLVNAKEVGATQPIFRAYKRDGNTVYIVSPAKFEGDTIHSAGLQSKTEWLYTANNKFQLAGIVSTYAGGVKSLKVWINGTVDWNGGTLSFANQTGDLATSPYLDEWDIDLAYWPGEGSFAILFRGSDNYLYAAQVDTSSGTLYGPWPVMKYLGASGGWVKVNATSGVAAAPADNIPYKTIGIAFVDYPVGGKLWAGKVCLATDCGIDGVDDDHGYIKNSVDQGKLVEIETSPNTRAMVDIEASDDQFFPVVYKDSTGKLIFKKADLQDQTNVSDPVTITGSGEEVKDFDIAKAELGTDSKIYVPVIYTISVPTDKIISAKVNATEVELAGKEEIQTGVTPKVIGIGITDPANDIATVLHGNINNLSTERTVLGLDRFDPIVLEQFGGGGGPAIPEFPTKWVAVLVGAVALIAAVAIASWRKKKEVTK